MFFLFVFYCRPLFLFLFYGCILSRQCVGVVIENNYFALDVMALINSKNVFAGGSQGCSSGSTCSTNIFAIFGSNCVPEFRSISPIAACLLIALRYDLSCVMAS